MNNYYHVLIWNHSPDKYGAYGDTDNDISFDNLKDALEEYYKVSEFTNKILMKYDSLESDADGKVIEEAYWGE